MAQIFAGERRMTDDEVLTALAQTVATRTMVWDGAVDHDCAKRAAELLLRARELLALTRLNDLIAPGLPLAACPMCGKYPDQIIDWDAEEVGASLAVEGFRRTVRGRILSITLDCGHTLDGPLLGQWAEIAEKMRKQTADYWLGEANRIGIGWQQALDDAEAARREAADLARKLRRARRRIRAARKALGGDGE